MSVPIGRIVRRRHPWEVTARRAGEDQRALQEAAWLVRGRVRFPPEISDGMG